MMEGISMTDDILFCYSTTDGRIDRYPEAKPVIVESAATLLSKNPLFSSLKSRHTEMTQDFRVAVFF